MVRAPVLAAGGIVLRQARPPLIAVVCLRKRNEWVLPKGKLDHGETARDAAEREVCEETGHDVSVHEFLGTLAYDAGGRSKIVHYWRMESIGKSSRELMDDVRAVDWLPLEAAIERLSREHERAFLANVGPLALQAAASARRSQETRDAKAALPTKRRRPIPPRPVPAIPPSLAPLPDQVAVSIERDVMPPDERVADSPSTSFVAVDGSSLEADGSEVIRRDPTPSPDHQSAIEEPQGERIGWMQRVRRWLWREG